MGHRSQCWFLSLLTESGAYTNQNGNSESVRLNLGHAAPIAMYLLGRNHLKQLGLDLGKERERESASQTWVCPKMGVPPNHPFEQDLPL